MKVSRFLKKMALGVLPVCMVLCCPAFAMADEEADRVDASIRRGLDFLARGQNEDGTFESWAAKKWTGIPALCGMAFLAAGETPLSEPNGPVIMRVIDFLLENAREDGYLGTQGGKMYSHCISTLFLSEVSGMVDSNRQERIAQLLPKAVKIILTAQSVPKSPGNAGGWRYEPNSTDSDMSCSGWALMALRSARLNGAPVPDSAMDAAVKYLLEHHDDKEGTFGYTDKRANAEKLTGAGLLCLELCGKHGHPATLSAGRYLAANYKRLQNVSYKLYGLYYTAQGLFQLGGPTWKEFADWMYAYWIPKQFPDGHWDVGEQGCPYYQTSMVILAFAVPYRQLPIYQRDETVDDEKEAE